MRRWIRLSQEFERKRSESTNGDAGLVRALDTHKMGLTASRTILKMFIASRQTRIAWPTSLNTSNGGAMYPSGTGLGYSGNPFATFPSAMMMWCTLRMGSTSSGPFTACRLVDNSSSNGRTTESSIAAACSGFLCKSETSVPVASKMYS